MLNPAMLCSPRTCRAMVFTAVFLCLSSDLSAQPPPDNKAYHWQLKRGPDVTCASGIIKALFKVEVHNIQDRCQICSDCDALYYDELTNQCCISGSPQINCRQRCQAELGYQAFVERREVLTITHSIHTFNSGREVPGVFHFFSRVLVQGAPATSKLTVSRLFSEPLPPYLRSRVQYGLAVCCMPLLCLCYSCSDMHFNYHGSYLRVRDDLSRRVTQYPEDCHETRAGACTQHKIYYTGRDEHEYPLQPARIFDRDQSTIIFPLIPHSTEGVQWLKQILAAPQYNLIHTILIPELIFSPRSFQVELSLQPRDDRGREIILTEQVGSSDSPLKIIYYVIANDKTPSVEHVHIEYDQYALIIEAPPEPEVIELQDPPPYPSPENNDIAKPLPSLN